MRKSLASRSLRPASTQAQKNILLIRWKAIGDVVFTLPALRCLRSNFPDSRITYLTSPEFTPLIESFAAADEILSVDRERLKQFHNGGLRELMNLWRGISGTRYDLVVDLQGYGETAWLSWLTRAPERWGLIHRPSRAWAYTRAVRRDDRAHTLDAYLKCLAECGLETAPVENFFKLPSEKQIAAEKLFFEFGLKPEYPTIFIQPFTSTPDKDWPLERWLALGRRLRDSEIQILFGGGPADRARLGPAMSENFPVAAGADLLTSCSLAARCAVVIGSDTGLLHLANAAGCRVIMMKHLNAKECPYGHPDRVLTPRQAELSVSAIEMETVLAEILRVLGPQSAVHSPGSRGVQR
ncbi:MAG TPA: glycosyltransferase family 9 protein [Verrucomicrobiae bacterium]|nr:glycosyltransferase family 9 protein [Verrucomicrobiae bacterium]